jgi:hypothetical protein
VPTRALLPGEYSSLPAPELKQDFACLTQKQIRWNVRCLGVCNLSKNRGPQVFYPTLHRPEWMDA